VFDKLISVDVPHVAAGAALNEAGRKLRILVVAFGIGMRAAGDEGMTLLLKLFRIHEFHSSPQNDNNNASSRREFFYQSVLLKHLRGSKQNTETQLRTLGNVQQAVLAIGIVQNPEHGQFELIGISVAAKGTVETTLAQLRLAFRVRIEVAPVGLQQVKNGH